MTQKCFTASRIKTGLLFVLLFQMLSSVGITVVQAIPETIVKIDPSEHSLEVGQTFAVNVTVVEVQNLYGVEVNLYWNSSILKPISVDIRLGKTDGVLYNSIYIAENSTQEDRYVLAATSMAPAPSFNGTGNIATITFSVISLGSSHLDLEAKLWDHPPPNGWSTQIEHTTIDGFVSVIPEFPNIMFVLLFLLLAILVVIISKKTSRKFSSREGLNQGSQTRFISTDQSPLDTQVR